jgi:uncharacterized membrane protein
MALVTLGVFPIMFIMGIIFYKKLFPAQKQLNNQRDNVF